jgi:hypothetical protein
MHLEAPSAHRAGRQAPAKEDIMKIYSIVYAVASFCQLAVLCASSGYASSAPLSLGDIVKPPVNISISGYYYSNRQKSFSLHVSQDTFVKIYSDGVSILGIKRKDAPVYYLIDANKKTVLKVSQVNIYRIGQFFNWNTMTTLLDLPANTDVFPQNKMKDDCMMYNVAKSDVELCVDGNHHIPINIVKDGITVARVVSVKPLGGDLKARVEAMILECRQQHYNFLDVDSDIGPASD